MNTLRTVRPATSHFHPDYPFLTYFIIYPKTDLILEELWFLWCMVTLYSTTIEIPTLALYQYVQSTGTRTLLSRFFEWFKPISSWTHSLRRLIEVHGIKERPISRQHTIRSLFIMHKPFFRCLDGLLWSQNSE